MDVSGSYTFAAPPDRIWDLLMDPSVISSCIPGCNGFEPEGEDRYRVKLTIALAAITGTYDGTVVIADKIPGTSYRLMIEGRGRPGFVKGSAALALRAQGFRDGGRRHGQSGGRWASRACRTAAAGQRVEDDAGPVLQLPAVEGHIEPETPLRPGIVRGILCPSR